MSRTSVKKVFSRRRISFLMAFGIGLSLLVLFINLNESQFVEATDGDYIWVDGNNNKTVDYHLEQDFRRVDNNQGSYKLISMRSALSGITWSATSFFWLFLALIFMLGRDFFYIVRIRLLTDKKLTWKSGFFVIMLWEFASTLTPGVVGGSAVAMFILKREGIPLGKATAIVIVTLLMDNLFYLVMIPFVVLMAGSEQLFTTGGDVSIFLLWWFWAGVSIILLISIILTLSIFRFPGLAKSILSGVTKLPFLKKWNSSALMLGGDINVASQEFKTKPFKYWMVVFAATFGSWISRYLVMNAILAAFLSPGIVDHVRILGKQLILWLFMLVSPTPGGSGVAEFAFGQLLTDFSTSAVVLAGLALIWRLFCYFPYLFMGAVLLPAWLRKKRA